MNELKQVIKPLYKEMLENITVKEDIHTFCMQKGKDFPTEKNTGFLVVGKATNGWWTNSRDVEKLFGNDDHTKIFDREKQVEWIEAMEGSDEYNKKLCIF